MAVHFIPNDFYVTRQARGSSDEVLGFMVPTHKDGLAGRKETADRWAGSKALPILNVPNIPMTGFSLINNTRRMMNKNVIWRVIHPYGFEFEITSDNFSDFLMGVDMQQGIIQTEMIFVRRSGENYLTPAGSSEHKNAVTQDSQEVKVSLKDLQIGDWFKMKNGEQGIYRGAVHTMSYTHVPWNYKNEIAPTVITADHKSIRSHFYDQFDPDTGEVSNLTWGTLNVVEREPRETTHTIQTLLDVLRSSISDGTTGTHEFFMLDEKPFKLSDLNVELEEMTVHPSTHWSIIYPRRGQYDRTHTNIVLKLDDGLFVGYESSYTNNYTSAANTPVHRGITLTSVPVANGVIHVPVYGLANSYYGCKKWAFQYTEIDTSKVQSAYCYKFSRK